MIGSSQHERTRRGEDTGSVAMYAFKDFQPVSEVWASQVRLSVEIKRLWAKTVGQSHFA